MRRSWDKCLDCAMFRAWRSPEAVFQLLKQLSRDRPCNFSGIRNYAHLDDAGGIQWPYPETPPQAPVPAGSTSLAGNAASGGTEVKSETHRRLFVDGTFFTPDGRARFYFDAPRAMPEQPDADYPFLLLTGRGSSAQWHTGSRTNKSAVLRKLAPTELYAELNPIDATRLGVRSGDRLTISSRRGQAGAIAFVTAIVQPGQIFLPMHFPEVNRLTFPAFDPHSRQPSYKAAAVQVKAE